MAIVVATFTLQSYILIEKVSLWVRNYFGYFYLYLGLGAVLFVLILSISPWGKIKLGKVSEAPAHNLWSWIAMLYSAGMGAGILLRAVQEPVFMYQNPPYTSQLSPEILALEYTFYQWGFTPWAFYGLFAVVVGYALFVQGAKVNVSSSLEGIIKNKFALNTLDIITILTTVFGLIAAIGLGTTQVTGGLNYLSDQDFGLGSTLILTLIISLLAFISVWKGVNKGIKVLSKINIWMTLGLLAFIFVFSDTLLIIQSFFQALGNYLRDFIPMSLALRNYDPGIEFLTDWTFYYWAFWLSWAPFTGIFIARISKGRTLREILLGVMIIPSVGTFFWFSTFGTSVFKIINSFDDYFNKFDNVFSSIFVFLEFYPMGFFLCIITLMLLVSFLVTSVDSAVFVLSMFTDKGKKLPKKSHKILWSLVIFISTSALIILGNVKTDIDVLTAVQKLLIITSLPFAILLVIILIAFIVRLSRQPLNSK